MKRCAVIAPHPDDETLGCGGTLSRLAREGVQVHWILMTRMTPEGGFTPGRIRARATEIAAVSRLLGFARVHQLDFPAATLDGRPRAELVGALSRVLRLIRPETIFVPHPADAHTDHRATFESALAASKVFRAPSVNSILAYETPSETDFAPAGLSAHFSPNVFFDISRRLTDKQKAFRLYAGEGGRHPFPRSTRGIEALATLRGAAAGCEYAEAFQLVKEIR